MADRIDPLAEALGVYVGPATQDEVVRAITSHQGAGADLVMQLTAPDGELVWHKSGYLIDYAEEEVGVVLVIARPEDDAAGNPMVYVEPPIVLRFSRRSAERLQAEQFSGGVRLRMYFGPLTDHTLTIVFWRSINHLTEDGDVAPGFGKFRVTKFERLN